MTARNYLDRYYRGEELYENVPMSLLRTEHYMDENREAMKRKSIYELMGMPRFR
jgi:hypothetical protein